jgi:hypothetical protein
MVTLVCHIRVSNECEFLKNLVPVGLQSRTPSYRVARTHNSPDRKAGLRAPAKAKARHDPDPRDVLDKLNWDRSLAEFIQAFTRDLDLKVDEFAVLAGVSTETIVWWGEDPLRLPDDLDAISALGSLSSITIARAGKPPKAVRYWIRSLEAVGLVEELADPAGGKPLHAAFDELPESMRCVVEHCRARRRLASE